MPVPLPPVLPDRLPDYLPGRIRVVADDAWPLDDVDDDGVVRTTLPRYGLHLRTRDVTIDPDRVRWLAERASTRALATRHAHVVPRPEGVYVVAGHHALAAHLATGGERIPIKLVAARERPGAPRWPTIVADRPSFPGQHAPPVSGPVV